MRAWDLEHRCAAGYVVDLFRLRPNFSIMAIFNEYGNLGVADVLRLLEEANERNKPLIGKRDLSHSSVKAKIQTFHAEGLLTRTDGADTIGAHARYELTGLGTGLVTSVASVGDYGLANWNAMVRATRVRYQLPLDAPIPPPANPLDTYSRRLATSMALGTLASRWSYACLIWLVHGPATAAAMRDQVNASLAAIDRFESRVMHAPNQFEMLRRLTSIGLVEKTPRPRPGVRPEVVYQHSRLGADLITALWDCTAWSIANTTAIWPIVQGRQHWGDDD